MFSNSKRIPVEVRFTGILCTFASEKSKFPIIMDNTGNLYIKKYKVDRVWEESKKFLLNFVSQQPYRKVIASSLGIQPKYTGKFALLPENLNLDEWFALYPLTDYMFMYDETNHLRTVNKNRTLGSYFDIERLIYIIGLISSIPAHNKDSISEDGYVRINSNLLRNFFKDYLSYLDYLVQTGILDSNGSYTTGRSYGYKFSTRFENQPLVRYTYLHSRDTSTRSIQDEVYSEDDGGFIANPLLEFPYLSYWFQQEGLQINSNLARHYAFRLKNYKLSLGYEHWDKNRKKWSIAHNDYCRKHPVSQYSAALYNIEAIVSCDYKAKIDTNVHRLHSAITNMQKDYRNFLSYNGQSLVSIDISNSQPYLLCLLLNPAFWDEHSTLPINIGELPNNAQARYSADARNQIIEHLNSTNSQLFSTYISKASEGLVYDYMVEVINSDGESSYTRDDVKTMILVVFFSDNRYLNQPSAKPKRIFQQHFPQIYELISLTKSRDKKDLACLLQTLESEIILHRCCKRIWEEHPAQIPVFTIHDSICTTTENVEYVRGIMQEELRAAIGISPNLKIEEWELSKLKHQEWAVQ